jgi:hypothetical protein
LKFTALCGLLTLVLTGCGSLAGVANATATVTASSHGPRGATPLPCTGIYTASPAPALILSNGGATSGSAHVGDVFQIVLDGGHVWNLTRVTGSATAENPVGMFNRTTGNCVWRFKATMPGAALIAFTGVANCARDQACPDYAILAQFSVEVS